MIQQAFKQTLIDRYRRFCQTAGKSPSPEGLVEYLMDRNLISPEIMRQVAIRNAYEQLPEDPSIAGKAERELAKRFNLSLRAVRAIIRTYR